MKKSIVLIVGALAAIAIMVVWFAVPRSSGANEKMKNPETQKALKGKNKKEAPKGSHTNRLARIKGPRAKQLPQRKPARPTAGGDVQEESVDPMEALFGNLEPAEKAVAIRVQNAMDENDASGAFTAALKALDAKSPEVRKHAINALSWSGGNTLPHLTKMLKDSDEEVAELALTAVENALMNMDDSLTQFKAAALYMNEYKDNPDALAVFSGIMSASGGNLLETVESRKMVIDTVQRLIYSGGACGDEAKDLYRGITGLDWTNQGEADKWVQNPDACSGPET